jgi:hypothetical protein
MTKFLTKCLLFCVAVVAAHSQSYCNLPSDDGRSWQDFNGVTYTCFWKSVIPAPSSNTTTYSVPALRSAGVMGWKKFSIAFIANNTADCKTSGGCITVNNSASIPTTATLTQAIGLLDSRDIYIQAIRVRTTGACSGASTILLTGVGDSVSSATRYVSAATFDLTAAVTSTNFAFLTIAHNFTTAVGTDTLTTTITTTGTDVNTIVAGCAFDLEFLISSLPL